MTYSVTLIGFTPEDSAFIALLRANCHVWHIVDCKTDFARAAALQNDSLDTVFFINTRVPAEQIIRFTDRLLPVWRRGIIVGGRDNRLAYLAHQTHQIADYIELPTDAKRLEETFDRLQYWKDF